MLCWLLWLFLKEEREHLVSNQEKADSGISVAQWGQASALTAILGKLEASRVHQPAEHFPTREMPVHVISVARSCLGSVTAEVFLLIL